MSTPLDIYRQAQSYGLELKPKGDRLLVFGKDCPPDFANVLREHKGELLDWLSRSPCPGWQAVPPDNLPLHPAMPLPTAENRERVIAYLLRQGCDRTGPLTAWVVHRENAYFDGPGRLWDCALHAYAAARDAACWQLNRNEVEVWELLEDLNNIPTTRNVN